MELQPETLPPRLDRIPNRLAGLRVLVVDDVEDVRNLLAVLLVRAGAEVRTADGAEAALEAIAREKPDMILTDLGMPDVDGFGLLDRVRHLPDDGRNIRAIALTGFQGLRDRCLAAGFQDQLDKPIELAQLLDAIVRVACTRPSLVIGGGEPALCQDPPAAKAG